MTLAIAKPPLRPVDPVTDVPGSPPGCWTIADYWKLPDDDRQYEIFDGVLYAMYAPNAAHQNAQKWFMYYLTAAVELPGLGRVFGAPFTVEFGPGDVAQPDVMVVLNGGKAVVTETHAFGPPDLVVEILSPSTSRHDQQRKYAVYERAGVREYWLADAAAQTIEVLRLVDGKFVSAGIYWGDVELPAGVLPRLDVKVAPFFA